MQARMKLGDYLVSYLKKIGTGIRPLVLSGDGGFQMTGVEIAHAPRYKLNPVVVLLNNGGWGIFRPIAKRQDLLALPSWQYAELARLWGGVGFRVETVAELQDALEEAAQSPSFVIIEAMIGSRDLSRRDGLLGRGERLSGVRSETSDPHRDLRRIVKQDGWFNICF